MKSSEAVRPPLYDEVDYILAPEEPKIDLRTFLSEFPTPEDVFNKPRSRESLDLPAYSCTVSRCGRLLRKMENVMTDEPGKVHCPFRRNWTETYCVVRGTKLEIYRRSSSRRQAAMRPRSRDGTISRSSSMPVESTQSAVGTRPRSASAATVPSDPSASDLLAEYSLFGAVAGVACDYTKKQNVLRVRVERDQFLIECNGSRDAIEWLDTLQKAAIISEPLETRAEPSKSAVPSRSVLSRLTLSGFICAPRRRRTKAKDQPYEVFEAAPGAPLRQRTHFSLLGAPGNSSRGLTAAARATEAAVYRADLRRAFADSLTSDYAYQLGALAFSHTVASPITRGDSTVSTLSVPGVEGTAVHGAHRSEKSLATDDLRPRRQKAERFVCAVLPATLPRKPTRYSSQTPAQPVC